MRLIAILWFLCLCSLALGAEPSLQGHHGHYALLTADPHTQGPVESVDWIGGPAEKIGPVQYQWFQLEARAQANAPALFTLRILASEDLQVVQRYILRLPGSKAPLEYRDVHTGRALLPAWRDFGRHFLPQASKSARRKDGLPETASYLGHTLTLQWTSTTAKWEAWNDIKVLDLDRELLVGTGRNFRDKEGHRLPQTPQRQDYHYIPFTQDEYRTMIDVGMNLFIVDDAQTAYVTDEPVFFLRSFGTPGLASYPADLYRSNYVGPVMFMDEPAILMVGDKLIHNTLRYFSDATQLVTQRVRSRYSGLDSYGAFLLDGQLRKAGVALGDMRVEQWDYPAWETIYPMAHYELAAGVAGIVHEGRYQLAGFDREVAPWIPAPRQHTPEEMLRYHYAFLRGAARVNGKYWGTSIYGQADPAISPLAMTLAYDMGARYLWFWTSDHEHHMPWPEQLALARQLKAHRQQHPRPSIEVRPVPMVDTAIAIPDGYFLSTENLWWVRALDKEGKNDASQRYARLMRRAHAAIEGAMERKEDFDVVVQQGGEISGYRRVIRITDEP